MITLQDILEVENTSEVLDFVCPGTDYLLWPRIRASILRMIIGREVYQKQVMDNPGRATPVARLRQVKCLLDGLVHNPRFLHRRAPIVFFSSGITNVRIDGRYLNRVSDYFALCYPESTLLIEDPHEWRHLRPRVNRNVAYNIPFEVLVRLSAKFPWRRQIKREPILTFVGVVDDRVKSIFGSGLSEGQLEYLRVCLFRYCDALKPQLRLYERLYRRLDPAIVFFEDGCYGARGHLIRLADEMGIQTAEMQHGLISAGHDAYNFAPALLASEQYRRYVPRSFLAYGQWWADHIHIPSRIVVVGNPFHEAMHRKWRRDQKRKTVILLLSDGVAFPKYLELACQLKRALGNGLEIVVRPHPLERTAVLQQYGRGTEGIAIDDSEDLYQRLAQSYAVIGEISTALFEALGLVEKIFSLSSPSTSFGLPDNPFEQFSSVDQLVDRLREKGDATATPNLAAALWAENWEANYRDFITQQVGTKVG